MSRAGVLRCLRGCPTGTPILPGTPVYLDLSNPTPMLHRSPESNCVVGNFFSLRGDHTKAVMYFDRAVKLDKNYLR